MHAGATALHALAERYWQFLRHEQPLTAFLAGQPNDDPTMFRESPDDHARRARTAAALRSELAALSDEGLAFQDRITHRLLRRELDDLCESHAVLSHLRPWLLPAGPEFNTIFFAQSSQVGDAVSARAYVDRLETLPRYFTDLAACFREALDRGLRYPKVVLEPALRNLRSAAQGAAAQSPWHGPFLRSPARAQPAVQREGERALTAIEGGIAPGLQSLADMVERELLPRARDTLACTDDPLGEAYYAFWVRHFTTTRLAPAEIHALGLAQVARLEREMAEVAAKAGHAGNTAAYRAWLMQERSFIAPSADALRERLEALAKRIDGRIPSIIGHLPRTSYGVQSIPPAAAEKLPIAYAQPNPGDRSSAGMLWVSSLPERVPTYLLVSLALHEAWPGHLMHIALMQEMESLPMFRRGNFTQYTACLEGWAMYCETLGHDLDLYETPHQHFGRLDMEMWRACRLVVDTGLHVQGWTRDQAIGYMAQRLTMTRAAIEAEVDRYIAMPGQALAYLIGGLKFRELRGRAEQRLGDRFALRAFHDRLMAAGAVTLPVLEETIEDWLDSHAA